MLIPVSMSHRARTLLAFAALTLGATLPAAGQDPASEAILRERFAGEWRYDGSATEGRRIIARAIDRGVEDMFFLARGIARGRLEDANRFSPTVRFRFPTGRIAITFERRFTYDTPDDGRWTMVTDPQGEQVSCSQRFVRGRIVQVFRTDEGARTNVFELFRDAQRLQFLVDVDGDALPQPVRYRLDYHRADRGR